MSATELPEYFFFYDNCRDDAEPGWKTKAIIKDSKKGQPAKLYGHKMYQHRWYGTPFIIKSKYDTDFIIGRIVTYPQELFDTKAIRKYYQVDDLNFCSHSDSLPASEQILNVVDKVNDRKAENENEVTTIQVMELLEYVYHIYISLEQNRF